MQRIFSILVPEGEAHAPKLLQKVFAREMYTVSRFQLRIMKNVFRVIYLFRLDIF